MALQSYQISVGALRDADNNGKNYVSDVVIYVKKQSDDTLADIFTDVTGQTPIVQDGNNNKTDASGSFTIAIDSGDYYYQIGSEKRLFSIGVIDYRKEIEALLVAQGLSGNYGFFEKGFTYNESGDVGIDTGGTAWTYNGSLPFVVDAGVTPSEPDYSQSYFKSNKYHATLFDNTDDLAIGKSSSGYKVKLSVGDKIIILSRGSEIWNITSSKTVDGYLVVDAGNGLQASAVLENRQVTTKLFGFSSVETGEAQRFNDYLTLLSSIRYEGVVTGNVFFEEKITFPSNVTLTGKGTNFSSSLIPVGAGYIEFDADTGFCQNTEIKDLLVYGDRTTADEIIVYGKKCYSIKSKNVRIFDLEAGKTGVMFSGGGDCRIDGLVCRPKSGSSPLKGIIVDCGATVDGIDHTLTLDNPDIEGCQTLLECVTGHADVKGWYGERASSIGIDVKSGGSLALTGGSLVHSGGSAVPLINRGGKLNVSHVRYFDSTDGLLPDPYRLLGNASKSSFSGIPTSQIRVDSNAIGQPSYIGQAEDGNTESKVRTSAVMAADETVKVVEFSVTAAARPSIFFTVTAWVNSSGFGKSLHKADGMVTRNGSGAMEITALTELVAVDETTSANYSVALELARNNNTTTADVSCTLRLTGSLNSSQTPQVEFMVDLHGVNNNCKINII